MQSADLLRSFNPSLFHCPNHRRRRHSSSSPSLPFRHSPLIRPLRNVGLLRLRLNPNSHVYAQNEFYGRELEIAVNEFEETGCSDLPVEICLTKNLDPALTLRHAVDAMKEAIDKLKLDPPCSRSGVLRFQIAVPPSVKSLNWLHSQSVSDSFPQFYLATKTMHEQFNGLVITPRMLGVSGVGAAITFRGSSDVLRVYKLMERYLSFESPLLRTYGFTGIDWNMKSNEMYNPPGSFYFFIPQIEMVEFENFSSLTSNLVWDNSLSYTLNEAAHSLERSLHQINLHISSASTHDIDMWGCFEDPPDIKPKEDFTMVYMNAEILKNMLAKGRFSSREEPTNADKSYYRHSSTVFFSKNMLLFPHGTSKIYECTNINLLWASLIVEECVRLGLMYFCIAPGSRSSPLALSACNHSLTTCTSCYDERSLAFHALGYARGSHKPAVVITSSGTAVSNLFPAVVEASQDFVPLLLLTADRPPELQDSGANQSIDQVNHFGKFVRFFYSLPPPTDQIPARMVLTTIDSAVYSASQSLCGPVHINCPFREPLEDVHKEWSIDCLRGLNLWISKEEPFTQYIKIQHIRGHCQGQIVKVLDVINSANRGLLLLGALNTNDEIWAALLLAKHLSWPIVPDVLSGLRLRKLLTSCQCAEDGYIFLDHLDHVLLSESIKCWVQPDVVVQIGRRITSKRVVQLFDCCSPSVYVFVDKHPDRQDPSHLVTHRVQCSIVEFAEILLAEKSPKLGRKWSLFLKELNLMVAMEISFQIYAKNSLTEPYVAHVVGEVLKGDSALFIGNSMPIRDLDMYGKGWIKPNTHFVSLGTSCNLAFLGVPVSGNRGASGIDGLLSSSIGFAVGSQKRVVCVIGDVSFLHDTNGLAILSNRIKRQPMIIIVINNHGGAIFSFLPIATRTKCSLLSEYFYTSHDITIGMLCKAHRVKHLLVKTKLELQHALHESELDYSDCVIEVESCIEDNAKFHSIVSQSCCQVADQVFRALSEIPVFDIISDGLSICKIQKLEYSLYRIQLCAPISTSLHDKKEFYHDGFVLTLSLDDNTIGYGEIAPIEIHKEDILDVEEQLRFLVHIMEGSELNCLLPLLRGSFSQWIWETLGIPPSSIFPSVRCGMEMAILNALAKRHGSNLSGFLDDLSSSTKKIADKNTGTDAGVPICALVDCHGAPNAVAHVVSKLFYEGFTTVKIKVARREDPSEDAAVISEIRELLGYQISIRVDANRKWTYDKAIHFGSSVKSFALEYIEEPVCFENDIIRFCEETGLPVALDETIDDATEEALHKLEKFVHPGIVAVVIKPSMVGGFENAALIAKWAQLHEKMAIVSSTFESSLGLSAYVKFAYHLEKNNKSIANIRRIKQNATAAHGLGTFQWLIEDLSTETLKICKPLNGSRVEASIRDADIFLRSFQVNHEVIQQIYRGEQVRSYKSEVNSNGFACSFKLLEAGEDKDGKVVVFLHGFLGSSRDWILLMKALSITTRCISIDLPGHGESCASWHNLIQEPYQPIKTVAEMLLKLICNATTGRVILVGYSMGGRIALYMSLKYPEKIDGTVLMSGSPGLRDENTRRIRTSQDESRASYLLSHGLHSFLEIWYEGNLWKSLRNHPHFKKILSQREEHQDIRSLAKSLTELSAGRQRPLWNELRQCKKPLLLIVGENDSKFRRIAEEMCSEIKSSCAGDIAKQEDLCEILVVPGCGHAVHLENPLPVITAVRKFITRVSEN